MAQVYSNLTKSNPSLNPATPNSGLKWLNTPQPAMKQAIQAKAAPVQSAPQPTQSITAPKQPVVSSPTQAIPQGTPANTPNTNRGDNLPPNQALNNLSQTQPAPTTFPGLVGAVSNAAQGAYNQGSQTTGSASEGLLSSIFRNQELARQAKEITDQAGQRFEDVGRQGARGQAGYRTTGTSPVGEGNAAILGQTTAAQQQAIAQGANMQLEGVKQGLAAQGQTQSGYNAAGSLGLTGQGQGLSGFQSAAGLTQPVQVPVTSPAQFINPQTGQPIAPPTGSAFSGGEVQGNVALGSQYAQNVSANNQARAVKDEIVNYLNANPNLNPSQFSDVNSIIQLLSGKISDPRYQLLSNYLSEYVSTLAPILGVGGDTTNLKTQIAQGFVNARQTGQSIEQVLNGIESLAEAKLNAQQGGSQGSPNTAPQVIERNPDGSLRALKF